jgi:hypothetical protein
MARVFLDVNAFSASWFLDVVDELIKSPAVRFAYSPVSKLLDEHEKNFKIRQFYKSVLDMGRRDDADADAVAERMEFLEGLDEWKKEKDCDDPHIFALIYEKPTRYVISSDEDMANCRGCIRRVVDKRYCGFIVVSRKNIYETHRHSILA